MKRGYQYLMLTGLGALLCLFLSVSANAQRGGGHSGGGRSGGGQSFSRGGGGGGFSGGGRSSGGFSGGGQSFSRGSSGGGRSYGGGQVSSGFSRGQSSGSISRGRTTNSYNGGSFSRGRTTNGFSSPQTQSFQRGSAYSRGGSYSGSPTFRRANPGSYGGGYRGSNGGYRGSVSIRGGFSRGGRYYPGGYGRPYSYRGGVSSYRYSPWASRGGYYYNRGIYSSAYYPRLGFSLGVLPYGYYPFMWGSDRFYYSGGYFYQYDNNQYTVVEPPIGAAVNSLPSNAQAITINGQQFYEANGVYYTPITQDDGSVVYQVAGKDGKLDTYSNPENGYAPENDGYVGRQDNGGGAVQAQPMDDVDQDIAMPEIGDLFYSLPTDSRKIKIQGQNYFVSPDDYYYQETRDQKGEKAYKVMGTPDNAPGN
ncbi:MAG: DUF6515 family protein [Bacteroidota bacterium]